MQQRSPIVVLILTAVTFGIYGIVWYIKTKDEMNAAYGAGIPSGIFLFLPILNLLFIWKWSNGAEKATGQSAALTFIIMLMIPVIGIPMMVSKFNQARPAQGMLRAA